MSANEVADILISLICQGFSRALHNKSGIRMNERYLYSQGKRGQQIESFLEKPNFPRGVTKIFLRKIFINIDKISRGDSKRFKRH